MKKLIYLIMGLGLLFTACSPMDDIFTDIDAQENPIVGDATYTLSAADYTALKLTFGSFSSLDDAKAKLPDFFAKKYPVWGKGSAVLAGFKLYVGNAPSVTKYTSAASYTLALEDYALSGSNVLGFYPNIMPSNYLANILAAKIISPTEGQISLVKYTQYTEVPVVVSSKIYFQENFDYGATAGNLTAVTTDWTAHSGAGSLWVGYTTSSLSKVGYPSSGTGGAITIAASGAEDVNHKFSQINSGKVYVSALVNLSSVGTGAYFLHFMEPDAVPTTFNWTARIGAKNDGSGKILFGIGASSSTLSYGANSFDLNTTYLLVASYDITSGVSNLYVLTTAATSEPGTPEATNTGNAGLVVQKIGVRQGGTTGPTGTIDGIRVASSWTSIMSNDVIEDVVTGAKTNLEAYYSFTSGTWKSPTDMYNLTAEDYDAMGTASGQPGRYNNFDSSMLIDTYISTFLRIKYPYSKEGTEQIVLYKYYSSTSGLQTRGNLYTVTNGVWVGYKSTIDTTLQFGHDGSTWVPDNTIKYEFLKADYDYIKTTFATVDGYATAVANLTSYGNISTFNWTPAQIDAAIGAVLMRNFPGMAEGQKFAATIYVYDGSSHNLTIKYILTGGVYVRN
ncbi:MAG: hypothetical protein Q7U59_01160 [Lutibacter sp.]|nr:hypothetical protein [Lutibacter sp.]